MAKPCNICGSSVNVKEVFAYNGIKVLKCGPCRLYFVDEDLNARQLSSLYKEDMYANYWKHENGFYEKHWKEMQDYSADILRDLAEEAAYIDKYRKAGKVLDVGCFKGDFCAIMQAKGWQAEGVDISKEAVGAGVRGGLNLKCGNLEEISFDHSPFDLVTMWGVIEHLKDPRGMINRIHPLLKKDGLIVIKTQNQGSLLTFLGAVLYKITFGKINRHLEFFYSREHLYRFSPDSMKKILEDEGFEIMDKRFDSAYIVKLALNKSKFYIKIPVLLIEYFAKILKMQDKFIIYARKR